MTVSVQGSAGQTVVFQTRKVKGSDLETDRALLDLDDIPVPAAINTAKGYTTFSEFYNDLPDNTDIQGPEGPQGPAIDTISLSQSVDLSTVTMSFTYQKNGLTYAVASTPSFTIPAGPIGPQGVQGNPGTNGTNGVDGSDGVSITDVNQVNSTTINFSKSDNTTTSNITLPSSTATDILPSYTNNAGKVLAVNSTSSDIEWITGSGTGTVTSVGITGSNGISVTGSPITTSGSIGVSLSLGANLTYNTVTQQIDATDTDTTYSVADANNDGLMSSSDFSKLSGIAAQANKYVLPAATASDLGGIKVGTNLSITQDGTLSATDTDTTYSVADAQTDGLMSSSDFSKLSGIATNANNYALPIATANDLGGFKVGANLTINSTTGVLDATDTNTTYSVADAQTDGLLSSSDFSKLSGIASNANNYALPIATANDLGGFKVGANLTINSTTGVLDATDTTYSVATTSADGLMSSTDKSKLNGIDASANNYSLPTATSSVLGGIKVGANLTITNGVLDATDTDTTYSVATTSADGLMSSTDKSKLNGIDASANNYSLPIASASTLGGFKVGTNLSIDANTGVLSATGGGGSTVDPVVMALALG